MRNYYFRKEKITPTLRYRSQTVKDPSVVSSHISLCLININYQCALACDDVELQVYKILDCKPNIASASYHCENTHELLNHQGLEKNVRIRCIYAVFPAYQYYTLDIAISFTTSSSKLNKSTLVCLFYSPHFMHS